MDGDDDKIYYFFTEVSVEYEFFGKLLIPRIARVCKVSSVYLLTIFTLLLYKTIFLVNHESFCQIPGGSGRPKDSAEEVDFVPEGQAGVLHA